MISKILLTLGVILVCLWLLSTRNKPELRTIPNPAEQGRRKQLRLAAFAFMGIMIAVALATVYFELDERSAVVTVHVINTQSGVKKSYRAERSEIHSDGFTTLDGIQVFVAEVERIEIEAR